MPESEVLRSLVIECLERLDAEGPAALEALCQAHPAEAAALRRRLAILGGAGLIGRRPPTGEMPERLGDFRLLAYLGGGGMGVVFEAEQTSLARRVALKLVRPEHLFFPGARERFRREVEAIARLQHPGIVPVHAVGEEGGIPFFAMERVHGLTLAEVLEALAGRDARKLRGDDLRALLAERLQREVAPFPGAWEAACFGIARQAAEALEHCHHRGVLHRDVKPSNLMIASDGRVQLLDFGVAAAEGTQRITLSGAHPGSPLYMSPEQLRGDVEALDGRTDVYSLGVTLYELLTLRNPYQDATAEGTRRRVLQGTPPAPRAFNAGLSRDAEAVCLKAMDVDRGRRYPSAAAFAHDLADVLAHRPVKARPPSPARRAWRWAQRHPAAGVALVAAVAGPLALAGQERLARVRVGREKAEAQASLGAALESIDRMLLRVGDRTLADVPQMENVRASLLEDAQALLAGLEARGAGDPAVLRLSARAHWRAGSLAVLLGRQAEAEASFKAAEKLFATFPDAARDLASVRLALGELLNTDPARAADGRAAVEAGLAGLLALPEDAETLVELSRAHENLGFLESQLGHAEAAAEELEQAIELARRALDAAPGGTEPRAALATALGQLGNVRADSGDAEGARAPLEESVALLSALAAERPEVADWRLRLGLTHGSLGHLLYAAQLDEQARAQVVAARDVFAGLAKDFPRVPRYRLELAGMLQALGALASDDPAQSEAFDREALGLIEGVAAESPGEVDLLANLSSGNANLALNLALQGRSADALVALQKSAETRRQMAAVNPGHPAIGALLDHQLRTMEMLLGDEDGEAARELARNLAREALEARVRDAATLSADARWADLVPASDGGAP